MRSAKGLCSSELGISFVWGGEGVPRVGEREARARRVEDTAGVVAVERVYGIRAERGRRGRAPGGTVHW
jgi:hypothetical protein